MSAGVPEPIAELIDEIRHRLPILEVLPDNVTFDLDVPLAIVPAEFLHGVFALILEVERLGGEVVRLERLAMPNAPEGSA